MLDVRPLKAAEHVAQAYQLIREFDAGQSDECQHEELLDRLFASITEIEKLTDRQLGPIAREVLGPRSL